MPTSSKRRSPFDRCYARALGGISPLHKVCIILGHLLRDVLEQTDVHSKTATKIALEKCCIVIENTYASTCCGSSCQHRFWHTLASTFGTTSFCESMTHGSAPLSSTTPIPSNYRRWSEQPPFLFVASEKD